jgi:KDO2-lipid IV(A) lauroyltransferase
LNATTPPKPNAPPAATATASKEAQKIPFARPGDLLLIGSAAFSHLYYRYLPLPLLYGLAALTGITSWLGDANTRRKVGEALQTSLPRLTAAERREVIRKHSLYKRKLRLSYRLLLASRDRAATRWSIDGLEHLEAALALGKGVVLVTTHFGYGRLAPLILEQRGYTLLLLGQPDKQRRLNRTKVARWAARFFTSKRSRDLPSALNLRPLLAALARNEIVLTAFDGAWSSTVVGTDILGQRMAFMGGIFSVAKASGAALLPAFVVDDNPARRDVRLVIEPALQFSGDEEPTELAGLRAFVPVLEETIARYPHLLDWRKAARQTRRIRARARRPSTTRHVLLLERDSGPQLAEASEPAPSSVVSAP